MKKFLDHVLYYHTYKKLEKLEYSYTASSFSHPGEWSDDGVFQSLPLHLQMKKFNNIVVYQDSCTTDEPILYESYKNLHSGVVAIKTHYLQVLMPQSLTSEDKELIISNIKNDRELDVYAEKLTIDKELKPAKAVRVHKL